MTTPRTRCDGCPLRDGQQRCALLLGGRLRQLFANEDGRQLYNVVDEDNRRIFGPSLARAGDYPPPCLRHC